MKTEIPSFTLYIANAAQDAAHGVRMLLRTPGFTAIALLMRPLPVRQPERVMTVWQYNRGTGVGQEDVAPGNALDWMKRAQSFEAVAMAEPRRGPVARTAVRGHYKEGS